MPADCIILQCQFCIDPVSSLAVARRRGYRTAMNPAVEESSVITWVPGTELALWLGDDFDDPAMIEFETSEMDNEDCFSDALR